MEIDIDPKYKTVRLKKVFNSIILETSEGNKFVICMRNNGLEIGIEDNSKKHEGPEKYFIWFTAKDGIIKEISMTSGAGTATDNLTEGGS